MSTLKGKKILLGISGSIAAYKSAILTRAFLKAGAEVKILMTEAATRFITPLTLSTLSKNPVYTQVVSEESWNNHVEMGLWADAMIIAPATATTLAKLAAGIADNMIVATYLSARCPVFFAPAMDLDMWKHPATLKNVQKLQSYGNQLIPVEHGELASGLVGEGRMAEPEHIVNYLENYFRAENSPLKDKKILITAGPTYEPIDPVRFIGNRSSGKMGIELALGAVKKGAEVILLMGPSKLPAEQNGLTTLKVETAEEMFLAAKQHFPDMDIGIMSAAVSDYRPKVVASKKIKKTADNISIELVKNPDIAAHLGQNKKAGQLLVGFALETDNELENAKEKLERKNFDLIILNSLNDKGAGFNHDTNKITVLHRDNKIRKFELKSKKEVATDILSEIEESLGKERNL